MMYNDRIIKPASAEEVETGPKVGDVTRDEAKCPVCGGNSFTILDGTGIDIVRAHRIVKNKTICSHCLCIFTLVYKMEYLHSKIVVIVEPEAEIIDTVANPAEVSRQVDLSVGENHEDR